MFESASVQGPACQQDLLLPFGELEGHFNDDVPVHIMNLQHTGATEAVPDIRYVNFISLYESVIVFFVEKSKREDAEIDQVRGMNPFKGSGKDGFHTHIHRA